MVRPMNLRARVPIISPMSLYVAIEYGIMYFLISTLSIVYEGQYGFDAGTSGLSHLPVGVGIFIRVLAFRKISDILVQRNQIQGNQPEPVVLLAP